MCCEERRHMDTTKQIHANRMHFSRRLNFTRCIHQKLFNNKNKLSLTTRGHILFSQLVALLGHFIFAGVNLLVRPLQLGLNLVDPGHQVIQGIFYMLSLLNKNLSVRSLLF